MFPLVTSLISGGASLLGSIFSSNTSAQNTQAQLQAQQGMQQESERFNAEQAQINRDYQTTMSNTAFQRSRADAQAAGLNPMVLAGMGGASTPSGSSASVGTPSAPMPQTTHALSRLGDTVDRAISSAVAAKTFEKMTEETANLKTLGAKIAAETVTEKERPSLIQQQAEETAARGMLRKFEIPQARFSAREASSLEGLPQGVVDWMARGGYIGGRAAKMVEPFSDLVSSAGGVKRLFPQRSTTERSSTGPSGDSSTFEERWHY